MLLRPLTGRTPYLVDQYPTPRFQIDRVVLQFSLHCVTRMGNLSDRSCSNEMRPKPIIDTMQSVLDVSGIIVKPALALKNILQFHFEIDYGVHWFGSGQFVR